MAKDNRRLKDKWRRPVARNGGATRGAYRLTVGNAAVLIVLDLALMAFCLALIWLGETELSTMVGGAAVGLTVKIARRCLPLSPELHGSRHAVRSAAIELEPVAVPRQRAGSSRSGERRGNDQATREPPRG
jgi:hypothetical protein